MRNTIVDVLDIGPTCIERFIDVAALAQASDLELTLAGCSNLSGRYCVARSSPLEHTLFYTLSGQGKLVTEHNQYTLTANTLIVLPAKQGFEVKIDAAHWDVIWLNLANTNRWKHLNLVEALVLYDQKLQPLHFAMEFLYSESNATLREGVMPILSHYLNTTLQSEPQIGGHNRLTSLFLEVEERLQFDWTIDAMCEKVHYSAPHLHRLCQAQFGKSPMQQLIYLRIKRAKNLLLNTRWPVAHIAAYVGYPNIFNFSKRFKKSVGVSPTDFRNKSF
ncbi:AraC family transcriptional regulator [Pseudoalteromonas sp. ESRF-bin5]|uniref:helix-turn-helix transcriptional regulator n=1 Tax=Pseudoalteromonas sp. ESRF-bin5 TaxID=2014532 RepID=UPI00257E41C5|nr:AraC family transcriptional regulator [Pseudoalteromonas sp. ESRF-bin5]